MAELADAVDSKSTEEIRIGSTPITGTIKFSYSQKNENKTAFSSFFYFE